MKQINTEGMETMFEDIMPLLPRMNLKEASKMLNLTVRTLTQWVKGGYIPAYHVMGDKTRFSVDELNEMQSRMLLTKQTQQEICKDIVAHRVKSLDKYISKQKKNRRANNNITYLA